MGRINYTSGSCIVGNLKSGKILVHKSSFACYFYLEMQMISNMKYCFVT